MKHKKKFSSSDYKLLKDSQFFDKEWYKNTYTDVKINPIIHYLTIGGKLGYNPSHSFDSKKYLSAYPDVVNSGSLPLVHYERFGKFESRQIFTVDNNYQMQFKIIKPTYFDYITSKFKIRTPKISIIVTCYNNQKTIIKVLDSILNQTYKNFEIIIINDGSKDNSPNLISPYIQKYDFINLHSNTSNQGLYHSIFLGINKAKGKYIAFCDGNDFWEKNYLESKIKIINSYANPLLILNDINILGNEKLKNFIESNFLKKFRNIIYNKSILKFTKNNIKEQDCIFTLSACMISQKLLSYCLYILKNKHILRDSELIKELVLKTKKIFYINKVLTHIQLEDVNVISNCYTNIETSSEFLTSKNYLKIIDYDFNNFKIIKNSLYFNAEWYSKKYDIPKDYAEIHYLQKGYLLGYNPSEKFDTKLYLSFYDDVKKSNLNPLLHYELFGKKDNRFVVSTIRNPVDVLFISQYNTNNACYIWRTNFLSEMFRNNGLVVEDESLLSLSNDFLNKFYESKLIIFSRPQNINICSNIIKEIIKIKKKFIIDIDDLLFEEYAIYDGSFKSGVTSYQKVIDEYRLFTFCYNFTNYFSVSTKFLHDVLKNNYYKKCYLLPNVISKTLCQKQEKSNSNGLKLLYTSGSYTHLYDVSTIFIDLFNILLKHKDVTLTILGASSLSESLSIFGNRIKVIPYSSFSDMLNIYKEHDLSIVPLDKNPFNSAKSNIKYIEAGAVATPIIVQDCDEFKETIIDGINGFIYKNNFYEKFEQIYNNKDILKKVGNNAFIDVNANYTTEKSIPNDIKDLL